MGPDSPVTVRARQFDRIHPAAGQHTFLSLPSNVFDERCRSLARFLRLQPLTPELDLL